MAKLVHASCKLTFGGDLSTYVKSASLNLGVKTVDMTAMGDTYEVSAATYKNWSFEATLYQDWTVTTGVDAILSAIGVGLTSAFKYQDLAGTIGTSLPSYEGTGLLASYTPIQGSVGEAALVKITIQSAGALTRNVTP